MMNFIPILPLKSIVYPTEKVNLHFSLKPEIQLIKDCIAGEKSFGIVFPKEKNSFQEYGTLAEVTELVKALKNGSIYVRIKGLQLFRILEIKESIPEKKYPGAIVEYPAHKDLKVPQHTEELVIAEVKRLYQLLQLEKRFPANPESWRSFDFAHKIGLNQQQEYEVLTIYSEIQRMEYIRRHLNAMMPVVAELEEMKRRIKMNGHFRNLS